MLNLLKEKYKDLMKFDPSLSLIENIPLKNGYTLNLERLPFEECQEFYYLTEKVFAEKGLKNLDANLIQTFTVLLTEEQMAKKTIEVFNKTATLVNEDGNKERCNIKMLFEKDLLGDWVFLRFQVLKLTIAPFISTLISAIED
jgi:hypothetical protein